MVHAFLITSHISYTACSKDIKFIIISPHATVLWPGPSVHCMPMTFSSLISSAEMETSNNLSKGYF